MLKQNDLEKIERYINGQANDAEKAWVESKFSNGVDDDSLKQLLEKDWFSMLDDSSPAEVDLTNLLDRIHYMIRKNENAKKKTLFQRLTRFYMRAAAILLLPLVVAGGYMYISRDSPMPNTIDPQASCKIYAPMGARVSFNLPDGTVGMLNSGSILSYSLPFNEKRHITLDGEAWFEVFQDKKHPFEITAGTSTVKVFGTKFNMRAYSTEQCVEVVLEEGKVAFLNQKLPQEVNMSPSERLIYQNGKVSSSIIDPAKYSAWTKGRLVFKGDPMAEVIRRIELWYNVKVVLNDKELDKYTFRATFEDDKLEDVMKLLSMSSPIRYVITPRKLLPDGTFEKEKVTIYLRKR